MKHYIDNNHTWFYICGREYAGFPIPVEVKHIDALNSYRPVNK